MVALNATNNMAREAALKRCKPKFMAKMKPRGAKVTTHPNMLMPPISL